MSLKSIFRNQANSPTTAEQSYSRDTDIAIPGMEITVEKILSQYGFSALDRLVSYYGDEDEVGLQLQGVDVNQLDNVEKARLLNDAYYETLTAEEALKIKYDSSNPNQAPEAIVEPQNSGDGGNDQGGQ